MVTIASASPICPPRDAMSTSPGLSARSSQETFVQHGSVHPSSSPEDPGNSIHLRTHPNSEDDLPGDATIVSCSPSDTAYSSPTASIADVDVTHIDDTIKESLQLPFARLFLAHVGAALTLFLATTDATIVSTSLPTIIADLHASQSQYPWVGIAYSLPQTALQPLYGRFSDLLGRKVVLYCSICIFMLGSLLCGLASNYVLLCIYRAVAGVGGGGIVSAVWLITAELVQEEKRAQWSQALSITWSASAVAGPLLGGAFSDANGMFSWRWAFLINLPVAAVALLLLVFSLKGVPLRPASGTTWRQLYEHFDVFGLILFMCGSVGVILGFSFSSQFGWSSPATLVPLIVGTLVLVLGSIYERHTKRDPLFPSRMFDNTTVVVILIISFLHNFAFNAGTFFLALYYQAVNGSSALEAGMRMLPYSLGSSLASVPAALFITQRQRKTRSTSGVKAVIMMGLMVATVGFGLLIMLSYRTAIALQEIAPLVAGIGIGMLFHAPYQILTKALPSDNIASATSAFFLVRFTGATCGLAVAGAVFNGRLAQSDFAELLGSATSIDLRSLARLQPQSFRDEVLTTVASAIQYIWIVCVPCLGLALLLSPLIKTTSTRQSKEPLPGEEVIAKSEKTSKV